MVDEDDYLNNLRTWKNEFMPEENYSDDELAYLALMTFYNAKDAVPKRIWEVVE